MSRTARLSRPRSNLRFIDFPADYNQLPTVAFVIPDQEHDMHNGTPQEAVPAGDRWLAENLDRYYQCGLRP